MTLIEETGGWRKGAHLISLFRSKYFLKKIVYPAIYLYTDAALILENLWSEPLGRMYTLNTWGRCLPKEYNANELFSWDKKMTIHRKGLDRKK